MKLIDYLGIPYTLCAESVTGTDGAWIRRLEYPQLPSCSITTQSVPEGLRLLDQQRVLTIVKLLTSGKPVPCPASPRVSANVPAELADLGLAEKLAPLLGLEEEELRRLGEDNAWSTASWDGRE